MSFKLINASAVFQKYIYQVLRKVLEKEVLIYLNDILIAHQNKKVHE